MHHLNREMTNKAVPTVQSYFFSEVIEGLNSSSMNQGENVFVFQNVIMQCIVYVKYLSGTIGYTILCSGFYLQ